MTMPVMAPLLAATSVTAVAALSDLRTGHIPNALTLGSLLGAVALHALMAVLYAPAELTEALLRVAVGVLFVSLVPALLHRSGGLGGADVKQLAAVGALLGPLTGLEVELYAFSFAMIYAVSHLLRRHQLLATMHYLAGSLVRPFIARHRRAAGVDQPLSLRFGPAIFAGTLLATILRVGVWYARG